MTTLSSEAERLAEFISKQADFERQGLHREQTRARQFDQTAALLRRIPELESWKARVIKAAEEAHGPGAFRFKMSLNSRGTASNVFPQWLDQRWVSFVYSEDDAHIGLHARIAQLEAERDQLRAELEGRWLPIESATEEDEKGDQAWLLVDGVVLRGYFLSIPFQEYRDADGFYLGQQDADAYWARSEDGEPVSPTHFQRITKPLPPTTQEGDK